MNIATKKSFKIANTVLLLEKNVLKTNNKLMWNPVTLSVSLLIECLEDFNDIKGFILGFNHLFVYMKIITPKFKKIFLRFYYELN